jgi:hypothetical protein
MLRTMRFAVLVLLAGCEPATQVVVLDRADRSPVSGVAVTFHRGRETIAQLESTAIGVELDTDEDVEVSVRSFDHAETRTAVPSGSRVEMLIDLPPEKRRIEIVPPAQLPMQADILWSSSCGMGGSRSSSEPFVVETQCPREAIAMIARDASGARLGWSAAGGEEDRLELAPWSPEWIALEVLLLNEPEDALVEIEVVPELYGRRATVLGARANASGQIRVPRVGTWILIARVWWEDELTTRLWTTPDPVSPLIVDLSQLLPRIPDARIEGSTVEWSGAATRVDGGVITAVYPDPRLLFWNVIVPPETTRVEFPPLAWTSSTAFEVDVEMLDADFVADYGQRVRELGPGFYPREERDSWSVDISTARIFDR